MHVQFYLGPAFSGAPPHHHNHAWNALAFGRKRWWACYPIVRQASGAGERQRRRRFLWPPAHSFYSRLPIIDFLRDVYPSLPPARRPLEVRKTTRKCIETQRVTTPADR